MRRRTWVWIKNPRDWCLGVKVRRGWTMTLWVMRAVRGCVLPSPFPSSFRDQTWNQSWHIGGLRSNCCLITGVGILTILEVLLKLTQFWKIIFILALNLNHFIISVQNNETWRWDHPFYVGPLQFWGYLWSSDFNIFQIIYNPDCIMLSTLCDQHSYNCD